MADDMSMNPTRDDFAALLDESLGGRDFVEGHGGQGQGRAAIEKDFAIIDVGLKTEGRIPVKEFGVDDDGKADRSRSATPSRCILERVENALGEAVISRDKARREEAWTRLEGVFAKNEPVMGSIVGRVKGGFTVDLGGASAFLPGSPGGHPPGARRRPADGQGTAVRHPEDGPPARQHRRLPPRHPGRSPRRAAHRAGQPAAGRRSPRRRGQEHHRLRRVRGPGRHRRPAARHRHELEARLPPQPGAGGRRHGQGADRQDQPRHPAHQPRHEAAAVRPVGRRRGQVSGGRQASPAASPTSPTTAPSWSWKPGVEGLVHVSEMSWTKKNVHPGKIVSTSPGGRGGGAGRRRLQAPRHRWA